MTSPGSAAVSGAVTDLVDGNAATSFVNANDSAVLMDLGAEASTTNITKYILKTGTDLEGLDPINWSLSASTDGTNYVLLDRQYNAAITNARSAAYTYNPAVSNLSANISVVAEAVAASEVLAREEIFVNVYALTSADRLYADWRAAQKAGKRSRLAMIVGEEEVDNPVVSVIDGHSQVLSFLGGALGAEQICLGSDQFGQSGLPEEIYEDLGFGQGDIEAACRSALL